MIRASSTPTRLRFSRTDYHRMAETGIIPPDARVELLDGEIIQMSPIGPGHSAVVALLDCFLQPRLGDRAICRVQSPLRLDEDSEPEPDLLLVQPRSDFYRSEHPTPANVLLLLEVADKSVSLDLGEKLRLYAHAGIPEYWVFDLTRNLLIVHRNPTGRQYASVQEHDRSASVTPQAFADLTLELSEVFAS